MRERSASARAGDSSTAAANVPPASRPRPAFLLLLALVVCCVAFLGGLVLKALFPRASVTYPLLAFGQGSDVQIKTVDPPPPPSPPPVPPSPPAVVINPPTGWTVYFANGSSKLDPSQSSWLTKLATLLSGCDELQLSLRGSVSSAKFAGSHDESDSKNLLLANNRAKAVQAFLGGRVVRAKIEHLSWQSLQEVDTRRTYHDLRRDEKVENTAEFLNRRVDIELGKGSQCPFFVKALPPPQPR